MRVLRAYLLTKKLKTVLAFGFLLERLTLKYWLNIDKPTQCVLHSEDCYYSKNKKETLLKGIGELKVDGGWLSFTSAKDARTFFSKELSLRGFKLSEKCRCLKKIVG
jgi:hypothetical protein